MHLNLNKVNPYDFTTIVGELISRRRSLKRSSDDDAIQKAAAAVQEAVDALVGSIEQNRHSGYTIALEKEGQFEYAGDAIEYLFATSPRQTEPERLNQIKDTIATLGDDQLQRLGVIDNERLYRSFSRQDGTQIKIGSGIEGVEPVRGPRTGSVPPAEIKGLSS